MHILIGISLVLVTWCIALVLVMSAGLPIAIWSGGKTLNFALLRRSMWWGMFVVTITLTFLSLAVPLQSLTVSAVIVALAVSGWARAHFFHRTHPWRITMHVGLTQWLVVGTALLLTLAFALATLGPVTNFDSGLYHLGAISYAGEFPAIPGLANLYGPLGYGNANFTLAAALGNTPLGDEGFRALNGFLIVIALLELVIRVLQRRWSAGTYVLLVGLAVALVPMAIAVDYWVTSPTQDSAVLFLTVVASAYFVDALTVRRLWTAEASMTVGISIVLVMFRPTMVVFALVTIGILLAKLVRNRQVLTPIGGPLISIVAVGGALSLAAVALRDRVLSGWFQYPLSLYAFDVPWQAPDPSGLRDATLGYARDPSDLWSAVDGWAWVPGWFARLPQMWETYALSLLMLIALIVLLIARTLTSLRGRLLLISLLPSLVSIGAWWAFSPPSFRFAWGPLFAVPAIVIGWCFWRLFARSFQTGRQVQRVSLLGIGLVLIGGALLIVTGASWTSLSHERTFTLLSLDLTYSVAPLREAEVVTRSLNSGLEVLVPSENDQCWSTYPLCTPAFADSLQPLGNSLGDGFQS